MIGLWFFQATTPLSCGLNFVLKIELHEIKKNDEKSKPTAKIVEGWCDMVKRIGRPLTTLAMDSYYMTKIVVPTSI